MSNGELVGVGVGVLSLLGPAIWTVSAIWHRLEAVQRERDEIKNQMAALHVKVEDVVADVHAQWSSIHLKMEALDRLLEQPAIKRRLASTEFDVHLSERGSRVVGVEGEALLLAKIGARHVECVFNGQDVRLDLGKFALLEGRETDFQILVKQIDEVRNRATFTIESHPRRG